MFDVVNLKIDAGEKEGKQATSTSESGAWYDLVKSAF